MIFASSRLDRMKKPGAEDPHISLKAIVWTQGWIVFNLPTSLSTVVSLST
jgi:hypothetical protein